jgi:hypothetical protein
MGTVFVPVTIVNGAPVAALGYMAPGPAMLVAATYGPPSSMRTETEISSSMEQRPSEISSKEEPETGEGSKVVLTEKQQRRKAVATFAQFSS